MMGYALVEVVTDRQMGCVAAKQLWIAAVPADDAVGAALAKVPHGWAARLSSADTLTAEQVDALNIRPGDAMEFGF